MLVVSITNGRLVDAKLWFKVMSEPFDCDGCGTEWVASARHVVRVPRPSDPSDWCGIMWTGPCCARQMGAWHESEWDVWIESDEARALGAAFLT